MSCRNVFAVLVFAGLLAGCDTYNAIRRDIGIDPRDPAPQQHMAQPMAQPQAAPPQAQPLTVQPAPVMPAPVMQGGVAQANWAAQRAATAAANNQGNTTPVGYKEPEKPAEPVATTSVAPTTAIAPATVPPPATRPARSAAPSGNATATRTATAPSAAAAPGLPSGYKPSASATDNPAKATEQQKMAAATGAMPEPPKMAGSMKEPGSVTGGSWRVHLASHRTESAAINEWQELLKANPQLYGQYDPLVSWVELQGRGSFARLELVGFPDRKAAEAACAKLRSGTRYCAAVAE
ncbi:MAG: SPOR domain-containing protein [Ferrovibrio sp.]|uniref:SPOR domain-containing protein n=1 Tax=Ferrovibrio sp. TaxID=1917215 RepID=UPI00391A69C8